VRFLVDMPLSPALAIWLRARGHNAVHASTSGLGSAPDSEILARAAQEARTVITADLDYPRLLALAGATGPSLILFRSGNWTEADVLSRMEQVFDRLSESDIAGSIIVVGRVRIRRRPLPLSQQPQDPKD
jgi:predicted nuclease of predicted toxin-antitoxin system